ncbi:MAG: lipid II flippase MurJ, partial [Thermus sp.]
MNPFLLLLSLFLYLGLLFLVALLGEGRGRAWVQSPWAYTLSLAVYATGVLQAHQRFTVPALAPLVFNLVIIGGTLWLGPRIGISGLAL